MSETRPVARSRRPPFRLVRRAAAVAVLAAAAATFPGGWGARLATWGARRALAFGDPARTRIVVERLSAHRLVVRDVALGGLPGEPAFDSLVVRYSPGGLLRRRVDSIDLSPVRIDPASFAKTMPAAPAPRRPAAPPREADPLRGWRIGSLRASLAPLDIAALVPKAARAWLPDASFEASLSLDGGDEGEPLAARLEGRAFGGPLGGTLLYDPVAATGRVDIGSSPDFGAFRPGVPLSAEAAFAFSCGTSALHVAATGTAGFADSPWRLAASVEAEGGALRARVERSPATIEPDDPVTGALLAALPIPASMSGLRLGATVDASMEAERAAGAPAPAWKAEVRVSEFSADMRVGDGLDLALRRGGLEASADGIGAFLRLRPARLRFSSLRVGRATLEGGSVRVLAEGDTLLVTEARAGFCGGTVRLYALSLDLERMSSGFTVLLDGLDAGGVLAMFPEVGGTASGVLNGKLPLGVRVVDGSPELRLRNAYLYSPPGQVGFLRLADTGPLVAYLQAAGVPGPTCGGLGEALHDLDYDILRLDLSRDRDEAAHLALRLVGSSTRGNVSTPVDLQLGIHGELERLLNLGIRAGTLGAGRR